MKKLILVLSLIGCSSNTVGTQSVIVSGGSFSIKTNNAQSVVKTAGPTYTLGDLAFGMSTMGDTASEPKRSLMTFPISALAGKTVSSVKLRLVYDSRSVNSVVTNLGAVTVYKLSPKSVFAGTDYSAGETDSFSLIPNNPTLSAATNGSVFEMDITSSLQASINAGHAYFTIKIRTQSELGTGDTSVNFYTHYSSGALDANIPRLTGSYN